MADRRRYTGGPVIAIPHRTVASATRALLERPPQLLAGLKVRSGEHLAAILATAFLGVAPHEVDTDGDVDLRFRFPGRAPAPLPGDRSLAAFEVKSMPGPFRRFDNAIDMADSAQGGAQGMTIEVKVESANDILAGARPLLEKAQTSLANRAGADESRNVFLVVHPFDRFAVETYESPVIAAALEPLRVTADTVWVLWVPDHLTVWSTANRRWADLLFTAAGPGEPDPGTDSLSVLQEAEAEFLTGVGHATGSPYLFGLSGDA